MPSSWLSTMAIQVNSFAYTLVLTFSLLNMYYFTLRLCPLEIIVIPKFILKIKICATLENLTLCFVLSSLSGDKMNLIYTAHCAKINVWFAKTSCKSETYLSTHTSIFCFPAKWGGKKSEKSKSQCFFWLPEYTEACAVHTSSYGTHFSYPIEQKMTAIWLKPVQELHWFTEEWDITSKLLLFFSRFITWLLWITCLP